MTNEIRTGLTNILRIAYHALYHGFAWSYDLVAWLVSFGRWQDWTEVIFQYLDANEKGWVLELGFGPGHLQAEMINRGIPCLGLDESRQMCRLAARKLSRLNPVGGAGRLTRGLSESIPYRSGSVAAVVATFPAEYIFHEATIAESSRVLRTRGRLIILMGVHPGGVSLLDRFLKLLYRLTDPHFQSGNRLQAFLKLISSNGFEVQTVTVQYKKDQLWLIYGHKV